MGGERFPEKYFHPREVRARERGNPRGISKAPLARGIILGKEGVPAKLSPGMGYGGHPGNKESPVSGGRKGIPGHVSICVVTQG